MQTYVSVKPGDLLLCYDKSIYDDGIELCERLQLMRERKKPPPGHPIYTHVAVCVGNGYVIEAEGSGLIKSPIHKYFGKADVWSQTIGSNRREKIQRRAYQMLSEGYRYSYWDIVVQFLRLVFGLRIPWHQRHSLICSVFGYDCWIEAGIKIASFRNCAPEEIALFGVLDFLGKL